MYNIFFRKNFYDGWDNVMYFFIPNLIIDALVIICTGIASLGVTVFKDQGFFLYIWIFLGLLLITGSSTVTLAWAETAKELADYGTISFKEFFNNIKLCIKDGIKFGLTLFIIAVASFTGAMYFLKPQDGNVSFAGLLSGILYIWCAVTILMALSWYPSLRAQMHNSFAKSIKKCFIIFFDNTLFSLILVIYNLFLSVISVIMLGLAPGMCGLELARANAIRLILKKYDYLDELDKKGVPLNSKERKISWKELLREDYEANPVRSFNAFIFPWKE